MRLNKKKDKAFTTISQSNKRFLFKTIYTFQYADNYIYEENYLSLLFKL